MKVRMLSSVSWLPFFAPEGEGAGGGGGAGGSGGGAVDNSAFLATLPEPIRGHEAFKSIKDPVDLATRYHAEVARPFAERLPEKIRGEAAFKDIKDLDGLATSYLNQGKLLGVPKEKLVRLPDGDDPKEWDAVYERLGRPAAADKYDVKPPQGKAFSDGDKAFQAHMLPVMHKAGLTQKQLDTIINEGWMPYSDKVSQGFQAAREQRRTQATEALKTEWGTAFDERLGLGEAALSHFERELKLPGLRQELIDNGFHHSPNLIKLLSFVGATLKEDGKLHGGGGGGGHSATLSPVEAQQQIAALRGDANFIKDYHEEAKSGARFEAHKIAVQKMAALYAQAFPGPQG